MKKLFTVPAGQQIAVQERVSCSSAPSQELHIEILADAQMTFTHLVDVLDQLPRSVVVTCVIHEGAMLDVWLNYQSGTACYRLILNLVGEGARVQVRGGGIISALARVDFDVQQNHEAPHTVSDLLVKLVAYNRASISYKGCITIGSHAIGADAAQYNKNLLLSDTAHAYSVPSIQVLTDQVSCKHGSATGRFDQQQLFYAQSRGIPEKTVEQLLIDAFLSPVQHSSR